MGEKYINLDYQNTKRKAEKSADILLHWGFRCISFFC